MSSENIEADPRISWIPILLGACSFASIVMITCGAMAYFFGDWEILIYGVFILAGFAALMLSLVVLTVVMALPIIGLVKLIQWTWKLVHSKR